MLKFDSLLNSLFILVSTTLVSCFATYRPNVQNVPLFKERGEAQVATHISSNTLELQGAYAFTNKFACMVNTNFYSEYGTLDQFEFEKKYNLVEAGLGYFENKGDNMITEIYVGYGKGDYQSKYDIHIPTDLMEEDVLSTKFDKYFVQLNVGLYHRGKFETAFSNRFVLLDYNQVRRKNMEQKQDLHLYPFIEPAFTIRYGFWKIRFNHQVGFSVPLDYKYSKNYKTLPFVISSGIMINIPTAKNHVKQVPVKP